MRVTIKYRINQPEKDLCLKHGTSNNWKILEDTFSCNILNTGDVDKLRAMHAATGQSESIWKELADLLDREPAISISIWSSY